MYSVDFGEKRRGGEDEMVDWVLVLLLLAMVGLGGALRFELHQRYSSTRGRRGRRSHNSLGDSLTGEQ